MLPRQIVFVLVAVAGLGLGAYQRAVSQTPPPARIPADVMERVQLGQTTPGDVERQFGPPHGREEDGAMVYHGERVRRHGEDSRVEHETTTFRFERGVLARVCRTRS